MDDDGINDVVAANHAAQTVEAAEAPNVTVENENDVEDEIFILGDFGCC